MSTLSANMNLPVPIVGVEAGPTWATLLDQCMAIIDSHNHSTGSGVQITPSGLNISSDMAFNSNNAISLRTTRFSPQLSSFSPTATDLGVVYVKGVDLYYRDVNGNIIQLTLAGAINVSSVGGFTGLVSPASATYSAGTFTLQSNTNTAGNLDIASVTLRNTTALSKGYTINPPSAMVANYSITLPVTPSVLSLTTMASTGAMGTVHIDNSTLGISGSVLAVNTGGITATQVANSTITNTQMASGAALANLGSNANFPGNTVQENSKNLLVSSTNAAASLAVIRGVVTHTGSISSGEGFAVSHTGLGTYQINYSNAFADGATLVINSTTDGGYIDAIGVVTGLFASTGTVTFYSQLAASYVDVGFSFVAIGQRT